MTITSTEPALWTSAPTTGPSRPVMASRIAKKLRAMEKVRLHRMVDIIRRAKALLMERDGMTEAQAHRFLQKRSMDHQEKLLRTAQAVLDGEGQN